MSHLNYDPSSGLFWWIKGNKRNTKPGQEAGCISRGRRVIRLLNRNYEASNLAWLIMTGEWPTGEVDHLNKIPSDNSWNNLRLANGSQNNANRGKNKNNTSGHKGVHFCKRDKKYVARIMKDRKMIFLGAYDNLEEAAMVYRSKAIELFREFASW
jgi:hypothetical protein